MKIGSITTSGEEKTIQLNYCPQFLLIETPKLNWDTVTQTGSEAIGAEYMGRFPQKLRVNVAGDGVILDAVEAQLAALKMANLNQALFPSVASYDIGGVTNFEKDYLLVNLADGFVKNKVTEIYIKGYSAAITVNIYAFSINNDGLFYHRKTQEKVLANSGVEISDFSRVIFGLNDTAVQQVDVTFRDGLQQKFSGIELAAMNVIEKNIPICVIDNVDGTVKRAFVLPASDTTVLVERLQSVKSAAETAIIVKERVAKQIANNPIARMVAKR